MRLNKFISQAGICARRAADTLISAGHIKVNGVKTTTLGYKLTTEDVVMYKDKILSPEKKIYILLNKPKGYVTTLDDPQERKTVIDLIHNACKERTYPVGRLDKDTEGLLLFTNDGDLARALAHPSSRVKKVYHVALNKELSEADTEKIKKGLNLGDGIAHIDDIYVNPQDKKTVGIEMHIGKNRIIRRIFDHLGYEVKKLDRTLYADLTKEKLPRGKWRMLTTLEIKNLKNLVKIKNNYQNIDKKNIHNKNK